MLCGRRRIHVQIKKYRKGRLNGSKKKIGEEIEDQRKRIKWEKEVNKG
jgi:hypothetical protein